MYDEAGLLLGEYDNTGTALRETVYLNDTPVAVLQPPNAIAYIYTDHLNTPRTIVNAANTAIWRWTGNPFGATPASEDPDVNGIKFTYNGRFPGQHYDKETGLHYN